MKKYNTKLIDFAGCHPVIAEALKRGEAIECFVHDNPTATGKRRWVHAYWGGGKYPYRTIEESFCYAEPIPLKVKRIMPPERAIPMLIAGGWKYNKEGALVGDPPIVSSMFKDMGGPIDNSRAVWPPCIIEEVENDD